jgi:hypothetical protein
MTLRPPSVCLACALLFCCAAAVSCGGGGGGTTAGGRTPSGTAGPALTLQEYFQKVQALNSQASDRFDAAQGPGPNSSDYQYLSDDQKAMKFLRDAIPVEAGFVKNQRDGLQQLSPPAAVKAEHQEAIAALNAWLDYAQKAIDAQTTATDPAAVAAVFDSQEARDVSKRLNDSCLALQKAALDHGITIELGCGAIAFATSGASDGRGPGSLS